MFEFRRLVPVLALLLIVACLSPAFGATDGLQRDFTFSGSTLTVINMIGHIEVVPATGTDFQVTAWIKGDDAEENLLKFTQNSGDESTLLVQFPVEDHQEYVYPELGKGGRTTITYRDDESKHEPWLKRLLAGLTSKRVTVRGRGEGLEVWADLTISVPAGGNLKVIERVGEISARDIEGNLDLDTSSGAIRARDIRGNLIADTGSGSVEASGIKGEVVIDTGSGSVTAVDVDGPRLDADTGSGSVDLKRINAHKIHVDTGSGGVRIEQAKCVKLAVDTGSGEVKARGISADRAVIDTGSGSVDLDLDHMGEGRFEVDTGSGGINLMLPADASARIVADTNNGGVVCKVEGAKILRKERNEMEIAIGGGKAQVSLDAGSGAIRIATR